MAPVPVHEDDNQLDHMLLNLPDVAVNVGGDGEVSEAIVQVLRYEYKVNSMLYTILHLSPSSRLTGN